MQKHTLAIAVMCGLCSFNTSAEESNRLYVNLLMDYYNADWNNIEDRVDTSLNDSFGSAIQLGYDFSTHWGVRAELAAMEFGIKGSDADKSGTRYGIDGLYYFDNSPMYSYFGLKRMDVYNSFNVANVGFGAAKQLNEDWGVMAEAGLVRGLNRSYSDANVKLGLTYVLGGQRGSYKPSPAPVVQKQEPEPVKEVAVVAIVPKDSDKDGILDGDDQCANTPMTDAVDGQGCTLYEAKETSVRLLVRFPHDSSNVNQQFLDDISKVAAFMKQNDDTTVVLEGHTSVVGEAKYNQWLSERRAESVAKVLRERHSIQKERITTVGMGEERPMNTAMTDEAHKQNRRVEADIKTIKRVKVLRDN